MAKHILIIGSPGQWEKCIRCSPGKRGGQAKKADITD